MPSEREKKIRNLKKEELDCRTEKLYLDSCKYGYIHPKANFDIEAEEYKLSLKMDKIRRELKFFKNFDVGYHTPSLKIKGPSDLTRLLQPEQCARWDKRANKNLSYMEWVNEQAENQNDLDDGNTSPVSVASLR